MPIYSGSLAGFFQEVVAGGESQVNPAEDGGEIPFNCTAEAKVLNGICLKDGKGIQVDGNGFCLEASCRHCRERV